MPPRNVADTTAKVYLTEDLINGFLLAGAVNHGAAHVSFRSMATPCGKEF